MGKQIQDFAEQCGFRSNPDLYDRNQSFDIPKFAELIVRECQLRVELYISECGEVASIPDTVIMKHFGVE